MQEQISERTGFLFDAAWDDVDPESARITAFEEARQVNKLIMIASESIAPPSVRRALGSVFTDLYAEGYPAAHTTREPADLIGDVAYQNAYFHRYGDRRYYKGTEFADLIEALAQNRIRHLFAPNRFPHNPVQIGPDQIQANVQPWSGANANTAVYLALLQPGDTIMGMNLAQGGHLSHGSPVNLSGRLFKVVPYGVDSNTGRIDYDEVERLAREHNPRLIVSGASAYPWDIDFVRLRKICDSLPRKAYLMADISHPAGLAVAGLFPNPVGIADVTTFTTHKTMIGPRAAIILTTSESLARRIDRAVFPGLQGGPHLNTIAALAVAFKIAEQPAFLELQRTIVANAKALAEVLAHRGLKIAYGGTNTHLLLVDVRAIPEPSGVPLNGEVAARILDRCGIVCNKNTIAGDTSANFPSGIRLGTPWLTQRGLTPDDMRTLGNVIADVLFGIETFSYFDHGETAARGKIRLDALRKARAGVADLIARRAIGPAEPEGWPTSYCPPPNSFEGRELVGVIGRRARQFLSEATDGSVWGLAVGMATTVSLFAADGRELATLGVLRRAADQFSLDHFVCAVEPGRRNDLIEWLEALSDGLVLFDPADPHAKIDGPVAVAAFTGDLTPAEAGALRQALASGPAAPDLAKPYF
ncbi:MAG: serine hydroxymethyltransferase, partial [Chloroflexota bacterium]